MEESVEGRRSGAQRRRPASSNDASAQETLVHTGAGVASVHAVTRLLKREQVSLYNCLNSIVSDHAFIEEVRALYPGVPLLANLRCGLWYTPTADGTCYYKSTDGHTGKWSFSFVRLNLHVARLASTRGGVMLVDATRKGKTFTDAFSKTVPMWCAVLNRAVARIRAASQQEGCQGQAGETCAGDAESGAGRVASACRDSAASGSRLQQQQQQHALQQKDEGHRCTSPGRVEAPSCQALLSEGGTAAAKHQCGQGDRGSTSDASTAMTGDSSTAFLQNDTAGSKHPATSSLEGDARADALGTASSSSFHVPFSSCHVPSSSCNTPSSSCHADSSPPAWDTALHLPLWVPRNEALQMEARLEGWVDELLAMGADIKGLAQVMTKPLRPLWIGQSSLIWVDQVCQPDEQPFTPLILISASQPRSYERKCSAVTAAACGEELAATGEQAGASGGAGLDANAGRAKLQPPAATRGRVRWQGRGARGESPSGVRGRDGLGAGGDEDSDSDRSSSSESASPSGSGPGARARRDARTRGAQRAPGSLASSRSGKHQDQQQPRAWTFVYVPGAGDDEESWAEGLTPELFWRNWRELLGAGPVGVHDAVKALLKQEQERYRQGVAPGGIVNGGSAADAEAAAAAAVAAMTHVETDEIHVKPMGCVVAGDAASVQVVGSGIHLLGSSGICLGAFQAGAAPQVWEHVQAVLDCGMLQHPSMASEGSTLVESLGSTTPEGSLREGSTLVGSLGSATPEGSTAPGPGPGAAGDGTADDGVEKQRVERLADGEGAVGQAAGKGMACQGTASRGACAGAGALLAAHAAPVAVLNGAVAGTTGRTGSVELDEDGEPEVWHDAEPGPDPCPQLHPGPGSGFGSWSKSRPDLMMRSASQAGLAPGSASKGEGECEGQPGKQGEGQPLSETSALGADSDLGCVIDSVSHPLRSDSYTLRSDSYPLRSDSHPLRSDSHPLRSDSYTLRSDSYTLRSDSHPLRNDSHPLRSDSHPLRSDSHPLRSDSYSLRSDCVDASVSVGARASVSGVSGAENATAGLLGGGSGAGGTAGGRGGSCRVCGSRGDPKCLQTGGASCGALEEEARAGAGAGTRAEGTGRGGAGPVAGTGVGAQAGSAVLCARCLSTPELGAATAGALPGTGSGKQDAGEAQTGCLVTGKTAVGVGNGVAVEVGGLPSGEASEAWPVASSQARELCNQQQQQQQQQEGLQLGKQQGQGQQPEQWQLQVCNQQEQQEQQHQKLVDDTEAQPSPLGALLPPLPTIRIGGRPCRRSFEAEVSAGGAVPPSHVEAPEAIPILSAPSLSLESAPGTTTAAALLAGCYPNPDADPSSAVSAGGSPRCGGDGPAPPPCFSPLSPPLPSTPTPTRRPMSKQGSFTFCASPRGMPCEPFISVALHCPPEELALMRRLQVEADAARDSHAEAQMNRQSASRVCQVVRQAQQRCASQQQQQQQQQGLGQGQQQGQGQGQGQDGQPQRNMPAQLQQVTCLAPGAAPGTATAPGASIAAAATSGAVPRYAWVPVQSCKASRTSLLEVLPQALEFLSYHLSCGHAVLIHDALGLDQCVCVAVALLLACFDTSKVPDSLGGRQQPGGTDSGGYGNPVFVARLRMENGCVIPAGRPVTKQSVRQALAFVSSHYPQARPTRGMLKQVFNFFEQNRADVAGDKPRGMKLCGGQGQTQPTL